VGLFAEKRYAGGRHRAAGLPGRSRGAGQQDCGHRPSGREKCTAGAGRGRTDRYAGLSRYSPPRRRGRIPPGFWKTGAQTGTHDHFERQLRTVGRALPGAQTGDMRLSGACARLGERVGPDGQHRGLPRGRGASGAASERRHARGRRHHPRRRGGL